MVNLQPKSMAINLWRHRELIGELIRRDISQRYRGSILGFLWPVITPLIMLSIYTFVFSIVFKARWQDALHDSDPKEYALILFTGLTAFNILSDALSRAPTTIIGVPNYVKKVVFPLEVFPIVNLGAALIISLINIGLLLIGNLVLLGTFSPTIYMLPLAYLPLILLCLGFGWFLASLGVFVRDLTQAVPVILTMVFFLTPIVYPLSAVQQPLQSLLKLNPMTTIVEGFRQVILWGGALPWIAWGLCTVGTLILAVLGYAWFMGTKKGFADVL